MALKNIVIQDTAPKCIEFKIDPETSTNNHLIYLVGRQQWPCGHGSNTGYNLARNGGGPDTTDWINVGSGYTGYDMGLGQYWKAWHPSGAPYYNASVVTGLTGIGFTGNVQKWNNVSGSYLTYEFETPLQAYHCYAYSFDCYLTAGSWIDIRFCGLSHNYTGYSRHLVTPFGTNVTHYGWFSSYVPIYYWDFYTDASTGVILYLDDVRFYDQT